MDRHPTELLEQIVQLIDKPCDLLCLALTCQKFHSIIVPYHIQLRYIHTNPRNVPLWNALLERPFLAANVRRLELGIDSTEEALLPKCLDDQLSEGGASLGDEVSHQLFIKVIKAMPYLRSFKYYIWCGQEECVFNLLPDTLTGLHICNPKVAQKTLKAAPSFSFPLSRFSDLTSFSFFPSEKGNHFNFVEVAQQLAISCPLLENLCFQAVKGAGGVLLKNASWPHLRKLTLTAGYLQQADMRALLKEFLRRHPNIESLSLRFICFRPDLVELGMLPKLHSLSYYPTFLYHFPEHLTHKIRHLDVPLTSAWLPILRKMPNLRYCRVETSESVGLVVEQLPDVLPQIRGLTIRYNVESKYFSVLDYFQQAVVALAELQHLIHIELVGFPIRLNGTEGKDVIESLSNISTLRLLKLKRSSGAQWVVLRTIEGERLKPDVICNYKLACQTEFWDWEEGKESGEYFREF